MFLTLSTLEVLKLSPRVKKMLLLKVVITAVAS